MRKFFKKVAMACAAFVLVTFGAAQAARADFIMKVGAVPFLSTDGSATAEGFYSVTPSFIGFSSTAIPGFTIVTQAGIVTAPDLTAPPQGPGIDLSSLTVTSVGGGTLDVSLTLTNLVSTGTGAGTLGWSFTGIVSGGTVTAQAYVDMHNTAFGTDTTAITGAVGNTSGPQSSLPSQTSPPLDGGGPAPVPLTFTSLQLFSLTINLHIAASAGFSFSSSDLLATVQPPSGFQIFQTPEPASMAVWGLGLALAGGVRCVRRRRATA